MKATIKVHNLFSTGEGGRHDWMRFHSDAVNCPNLEGACPGHLKWTARIGHMLQCDICLKKYKVRAA